MTVAQQIISQAREKMRQRVQEQFEKEPSLIGAWFLQSFAMEDAMSHLVEIVNQ